MVVEGIGFWQLKMELEMKVDMVLERKMECQQPGLALWSVAVARNVEKVEKESLIEKPVIKSFINAGIYLLNPDMINYVTPGNRCDMTDLILNAIKDGRRVISFPIREYWLDIGHVEDYQQALTDLHEEVN